MTMQNNKKIASDPFPGRCRKQASHAAVVLLGLLCVENATAEWNFDPVVRAAWDFDDNATLSTRTDQEEKISGLIGELSLGIRNNTENGFFALVPMYRTRKYGSNDNRDSDDQFLNFSTGLFGVRNDLRLSADFARESVRTAEIADADLEAELDPDEITDDESGRVGSTARRERIRAKPAWSYQVSDVSSLDATVNFQTISYNDRDLISNLWDYTDTRLRISYRRDLSDRNTGIFSVTARDYTSERPNSDSTGYGVAAGLTRSLSETTTLRALFGVEQTERDITGTVNVTEDPNFVTDISLVRRMETARLLAQYRQSISASGRGTLSKRNEFNLRFSRDLNDRFTAGLGVRAYTLETVDGLSNEQDYVQLRGQLIWRISQTFSMQTDYRYTVLNREILGEGSNSNRITVWFTYQPNSQGRGSAAISR
jgi:hypothetical protein